MRVDPVMPHPTTAIFTIFVMGGDDEDRACFWLLVVVAVYLFLTN